MIRVRHLLTPLVAILAMAVFVPAGARAADVLPQEISDPPTAFEPQQPTTPAPLPVAPATPATPGAPADPEVVVVEAADPAAQSGAVNPVTPTVAGARPNGAPASIDGVSAGPAIATGGGPLPFTGSGSGQIIALLFVGIASIGAGGLLRRRATLATAGI